MPINATQFKCLAVFALFALIGFGPISPTCLIGLSVVIFRPVWFWTLTEHLYAGRIPPAAATRLQYARTKAFLCLLSLFILDIAPVPVTAPIAMVITLSRPRWFYHLVASIYGYD